MAAYVKMRLTFSKPLFLTYHHKKERLLYPNDSFFNKLENEIHSLDDQKKRAKIAPKMTCKAIKKTRETTLIDLLKCTFRNTTTIATSSSILLLYPWLLDHRPFLVFPCYNLGILFRQITTLIKDWVVFVLAMWFFNKWVFVKTVDLFIFY